MLSEHKQSVKTIVYMLKVPLSTVLTKIEGLRMLAKAAKNLYSGRQLFEIAMNIARNTKYFEKGQANWYEKIPGKQTWEYFKTRFEADLRQFQKIRENTMQGTAWYQEKLLQKETTNHILGEFNIVKNDIIEAVKNNNKENSNTSRVKVVNNEASAKNDVLLTLIQSLAALTKEVQSLKNHKTITIKTQITHTNKQHLGMEHPFGRNWDENTNTAGHADQVSTKGRLVTPKMRLHMQSVCTDLQDSFKEEIAEIVGDIVVVWIRR